MITKMTEHQQLKFLFTEEGWLRLRKVIPDSRFRDSGKTLRALTQKIRLSHFVGLVDADVAAGSAKIVDNSTARLLKIVNLFYITSQPLSMPFLIIVKKVHDSFCRIII